MKRLLTLALAVLMIAGCAISFASCGGSNYDMKFGKDFSPLDSQMDVLLQLNAKSIDVGVMDSVMAGVSDGLPSGPKLDSLGIWHTRRPRLGRGMDSPPFRHMSIISHKCAKWKG